jgi:phenylpropionate dioxygenase-like ring-hydroxylating dioxygenase large terminal subunit
MSSASPALDGESVAATRVELSRARHLPGWIYSSPELYRREIEEIFLRDWLYAGRVEEVENPGDYMTMRIAEQSIVVARDKKGELHAYYNMCVHRGVEVAAGTGNASCFVCPYHGWTYELTGRLRGAGHMGATEGFVAANCRLKSVELATWRGNIFVCFNPSPKPFEQYIRHFEAAFANLQMDRCRLGNKIRVQVDCNWKLVHENLLDYYHVRVLHAETFGATFRWDNDAINLNDDGSITMTYQSGPGTPNAKPLLGKMPWLEHEDYTFASTGLLPPNFAIFGRIDAVRPIICWPLGPNKCEVIVYQLYPAEFHSLPDFAEKMKIYRAYSVQVLEEDRTMIESMQRMMSSPTYMPGPMSVCEKAVHFNINRYLDSIFGARGVNAGVQA